MKACAVTTTCTRRGACAGVREKAKWLGLLATLAACTGPATEPTNTTWFRDVRPVVEDRCVPCHREGGVAPFTFDDFSRDVDPRARSIVSSVLQRSMPPFSQDPDCRPALDSLWMDDEELALFERWQDGGYEAGDASDFEPPPAVTEPPVRDPDVLVAIEGGYEPDVARPDDYRCIPLGEPLDRNSWVHRVEVRPDQTNIVHHVILFVVGPEALEEMRALDEAEEGLGWSCFGDAGLDAADQIGGWVPGTPSPRYQEDVASRVAAGSQLVAQMHYSVAGMQRAPRDFTEVALWRLAEGQMPTWQITTVPVADDSIVIPAGEEMSQHISTRVHPIEGTIVGTAPHMHLLGTELRTELVRADGRVECLSGVTNWDFDWQRPYEFAEAHQVEIGAGDRIRIQCTYDNSERNQPFVNGRRSPPSEVRWGDGTRDEMCLDYLNVITPATEGFQVCAGVAACAADCAPTDAMCAFRCMGSSGMACLDCALEEVFGACAEAQCLEPLLESASCFEGCESLETDPFGCLGDDCGESVNALYECVASAASSGACPDAANACAGWLE